MNGYTNETVSRRLTHALDRWFQRASDIGAYLEYQIEGVVAEQDNGEGRIVRLLDEILPSVAENCRRLMQAERWISLHVSIQPDALMLECSAAGKYYLESGRTPEGVASLQLTQCEDSYQLRIFLNR